MKNESEKILLKTAECIGRPRKEYIPGLPPRTPLIFHQPKRPTTKKEK